MRAYCTLFDHSYLSRGLALYESLFCYEKNASLFILAMDDICYHKLEELNLPYVILISEEEFTNEELRRLKQERGRAEYCWTCTSILVEYVLNKYHVEMCTYLDADIFFFQSPDKIFEEMQEASVLITPHNFASYCDQTEGSGKYCVQFLPFVNDKRGRAVLEDWKKNCLHCCELAPEKRHCGDQIYLEEWMERFDGVRETRGLGIGAAPWNIARFLISEKDGQLMVYEKDLRKEYPLIFYHFHGFKLFDKDVVRLSWGTYDIDDDVVRNIYVEYIRKIEEIHRKYCLEADIDYDGRECYRSSEAGPLSKNYYKYSTLIEM